jgi:long-chain acyl-CoA synthetase
LLSDARPRLCIAHARFLPRLGCGETPVSWPQAVVVVGDVPPGSAPPRLGVPKLYLWGALMEAHRRANGPPAKRRIDIDLAALVYTSGSTGKPKGVMLTHRNMLAAATSVMTFLESRADDVVYNALPLSFDYGLYQALMAAAVGATLVLDRSFTGPKTLSTLARYGVTGFPLIPTMLAALLRVDLRAFDLSRLRYLTNTGAALPAEHIKRLRTTLPDVKIYSMYGLPECKRVSYLPPDQIDARPDSVGRGMPNEEVYVVDADGERVPPGVVGELVVRGANVMRGYWEAPEETAKRLKPGPLPGEQVLHTGDLFHADEEGYLYFVGRREDMIESRGEKVSPREVENVLCNMPEIGEAAVVGVFDPILGQRIKAFVVASPGESVIVPRVVRHCQARLEDYMVPQEIEVCEALPKCITGKVDKRALRAMLGE